MRFGIVRRMIQKPLNIYLVLQIYSKEVWIEMKHKGTKNKETKMDMHMTREMQKEHYTKLLIMAILSFICMFILMYAMVDTFSNVFLNINQFYMAGLMTAPMVIIEMAVMGAMYADRKLNTIIIATSSVLLIAFFVLIRQQSAVSDKQFLRSMIPHHASAILMCERTDLEDPEIKALCQSIISGQQAEIDQMKAKLQEMDR
jgi:uncharacterized protein (DUF305 family)